MRRDEAVSCGVNVSPPAQLGTQKHNRTLEPRGHGAAFVVIERCLRILHETQKFFEVSLKLRMFGWARDVVAQIGQSLRNVQEKIQIVRDGQRAGKAKPLGKT